MPKDTVRRDAKGRRLRTGENQRADGRYEYKYTDQLGKRHTLYSWKLTKSDPLPKGKRECEPLRDQIERVEKDKIDGIMPNGGDLTLLDLVQQLVNTKKGIKRLSQQEYEYLVKCIGKYSIANKPINKITRIDAKNWIILLKTEYSYSRVSSVKMLVTEAFNEAIEDDFVRKNPFKFKLKSVISDDTVRKESLTEEQRDIYLNFIQADKVYSGYYDVVYILFNTGMRISELCGLTKKNIDFEKNCIVIDHQLLSVNGNKSDVFIGPPKSKAGYREIPMTDEVRKIFIRLVNDVNNRKIDPVIDGMHGFLFVTRKGKVSIAHEWQRKFGRILAKYREKYDKDFPKVTPHICRHTFCTLLANKGMNIKALQYIMGHESIQLTADYYADGSPMEAQKEMTRMMAC